MALDTKRPNDLSAFWMPFTANRQFKQAPRMLVAAEGMHYTSGDGRQILDGTAGLDDPLTGARASIQGRIEAIDDPLLRTRYIRRHPSARRYAGFADFKLYRMTPDRAHLVAGFGRIHWTGTPSYSGETQTLAEAEAEILAHMNSDHLDAIALYANRLLGLPGIGWFLTGVDPEGCDLRRGGSVARLNFEAPASDAEAVRLELVKLVKLENYKNTNARHIADTKIKRHE